MQKQTNPKPSGAPMAKMILVVAMIISLGALFGAVGYLASKPKINRDILLAPEEWKNIFTTNKRESEIGIAGNFSLQVKNTLNKKIYYQFSACSDKTKLSPKVWLEKEDVGNKWEEQENFISPPLSCEEYGTISYIDCQEINPNDSSYYGVSLDYNDNTKRASIPYPIGKYRLKMALGESCVKGKGLEKSLMVYSNEFTIIEQPKVDIKFGEEFKLNVGQEAVIGKDISGKDYDQRIVLKSIGSSQPTGLVFIIADLEFLDNDLMADFSFSQLEKSKQFGDLNIRLEKIDLWSVKLTVEKNPDFSGWQTYRNEKYGFEVKYPDDFLNISDKNKVTLIFHPLNIEQTNSCDFKAVGEIVDKNLNGAVIDNESEYIISNFLSNNKLSISPDFIDEVNIGDLKGYIIINVTNLTNIGDECVKSTYYFPLNLTSTLVIRRVFKKPILNSYIESSKYPSIVQPDEEKIINQILSTFKFTDKDEAIN